MRKSLVAMLAAMLLGALSSCQLFEVPTLPPVETYEGMDDYDVAVQHFEAALDEVEIIQKAIYTGQWKFGEYGNRPTICQSSNKEITGNAGFTVSRMTPNADDAKAPLPASLETVRASLTALGFDVGEITPDIYGNRDSFHVIGRMGGWRILRNKYGAWSISGASICVDLDEKAVWNEMNANGFNYSRSAGWELYPHERLPIRRGETSSNPPTTGPVAPTWQPRTSTPATTPAASPALKKPSNAPTPTPTP